MTFQVIFYTKRKIYGVITKGVDADDYGWFNSNAVTSYKLEHSLDLCATRFESTPVRVNLQCAT